LPSSGFYRTPHPDGHLSLVLTVLSGVPPAVRPVWFSSNLPRTALLYGIKRKLDAMQLDEAAQSSDPRPIRTR
jgi:hypothetical protein